VAELIRSLAEREKRKKAGEKQGSQSLLTRENPWQLSLLLTFKTAFSGGLGKKKRGKKEKEGEPLLT